MFEVQRKQPPRNDWATPSLRRRVSVSQLTVVDRDLDVQPPSHAGPHRGLPARPAALRTLTVHTRTGQHVEHDLPLPWAPAAKLPPVGPDTLPPDWWGDRLDLGYAIAALLTSNLTRCAA